MKRDVMYLFVAVGMGFVAAKIGQLANLGEALTTAITAVGLVGLLALVLAFPPDSLKTQDS